MISSRPAWVPNKKQVVYLCPLTSLTVPQKGREEGILPADLLAKNNRKEGKRGGEGRKEEKGIKRNT